MDQFNWYCTDSKNILPTQKDWSYEGTNCVLSPDKLDFFLLGKEKYLYYHWAFPMHRKYCQKNDTILHVILIHVSIPNSSSRLQTVGANWDLAETALIQRNRKSSSKFTEELQLAALLWLSLDSIATSHFRPQHGLWPCTPGSTLSITNTIS